MPYDTEVKRRAHEIDPECWESYSGKPVDVKRAADARRTAALEQAQKEAEETTMTTDAGLKPPAEPEYLGDGVYASFDGYHIWLKTQEGDSIALEPAVYHAVRAYGARVWGLKP